MNVERVVVDAYVTDGAQNPIPNLDAAAFTLRVDGKSYPIESVEWVDGERTELEPSPLGLEYQFAEEQIPHGRLLIFLFQIDPFQLSRLLGARRMSLEAKKIVASILPTDRVAVLSFDSHLKLWQDFTADPAKLRQAIELAFRAGPAPGPVGHSEEGPSLSRFFDVEAARAAVTPYAAMGLTARAATPILGAKAMIFFGFGLQTIGGMSGPNPRDTRDEREAWPFLESSRITIFTLDVTDAETHSLERKLKLFSEATGGTYEKTNLFAGAPLGRILKSTGGRYIIVFRKPDLPRGRHSIDLTIPGRRLRILARPDYVG